MPVHQHAHAHEAAHLEKRTHFVKANVDGTERLVHIAGLVSDNKKHFIHDSGHNVEDVVTVTSHVYVTASKTFSGAAVYVTESDVDTSTAAAAAAVTTTSSVPSVATSSTSSTQNSYESAKSLAHKSHNRHSTTTTTSGNPHTTARIVGGTKSTHHATTRVVGTPVSVTGTTGDLTSSKHHGMTSGAKAGLAIGILAILALVAGLALFCVRRRRNQVAEKGEKLDEKHASQGSFFSGTAAAFGASAGDKRASMKSTTSSTSRTAATAPRLSLRAVPSLFPGGLMSGTSTPPMSEKRGQNPFTDAAVVSDKQANPFEDRNTPNHSSQASLDGAQVGTAAAVAVGGAAAAGARGPNNVHRVQLDFKPSMDDELELKSGQLVRMLHEYDDGWALCIRMDRTQQGVCPRTCLSKLPVKPRPNPQAGPNGRPMGPPPPGMRGPPPPGSNNMMPRPLTPTGRERASTAGSRTPSPVADEENRSRSQSVTERPVSPVEGSVPARKPVPGQAM